MNILFVIFNIFCTYLIFSIAYHTMFYCANFMTNIDLKKLAAIYFRLIKI